MDISKEPVKCTHLRIHLKHFAVRIKKRRQRQRLYGCTVYEAQFLLHVTEFKML